MFPTASTAVCPFVANKRSKGGRKLPFQVRTRANALELFYRTPEHLRRNMRIPRWFSQSMGVPAYLFRIRGSSLSPKQSAVSTVLRLYFIYRYILARQGRNTNQLIKSSRWDGLHHLLYGLNGDRNWSLRVTLALRRLKVLLCPQLGPLAEASASMM